MEVRVLERENAKFYSGLFLPQVAEEIENSEETLSLILQSGRIAVGALAGKLEEDSFVITSLYVAENYRREGGATLLFETLKEAVSSLVTNIKIHYLEQEEDGLEAYLDVCGFEEEITDTRFYRIFLEEIEGIPLFQKDYRSSEHISSFSGLKERDLEWLSHLAEKQNSLLPPGGFLNSAIDKNLSIIYQRENEIMGYLLFDEKEGSELMLSALWADPKNPAVAVILLREAKKKMEETGKEVSSVLTEAVNERSEALLKKLLPTARQVNRSWNYRI